MLAVIRAPSHALLRFVSHPGIGQLVAVVPGDRLDELQPGLPPGVIAVAGGATRHESVAAGLARIEGSGGWVLVHLGTGALIALIGACGLAALTLAIMWDRRR